MGYNIGHLPKEMVQEGNYLQFEREVALSSPLLSSQQSSKHLYEITCNQDITLKKPTTVKSHKH